MTETITVSREVWERCRETLDFVVNKAWASGEWGQEEIRWLLTEVLINMQKADRPNPWQPIETAPKDGTRILGVRDDKFFVCRLEKRFWTIYLEKKDRFIDKLLGCRTVWLVSSPTHWQPLPPPPEEKGGE